MNVFQKDPFLVIGSTSKVRDDERGPIIRLMKMMPPWPPNLRTPGDDIPKLEVEYVQYYIDDIWQDLSGPDSYGRKRIAKKKGVLVEPGQDLEPLDIQPWCELIYDLEDVRPSMVIKFHPLVPVPFMIMVEEALNSLPNEDYKLLKKITHIVHDTAPNELWERWPPVGPNMMIDRNEAGEIVRTHLFHHNIMFLDPRKNKPKLVRDLYLDCINQIKGADEWPVRIYQVGIQIDEE